MTILLQSVKTQFRKLFNIFRTAKSNNAILLQNVTGCCFKVRQILQSATDCYYKLHQELQSVTDFIANYVRYYKVLQLLQSET